MNTLTDRQREILALIGQGLSTAEIAHRLCRTVKTVESHRLSLGKKLGGRNRVELALIANEAGLCGDHHLDLRPASIDPESLRCSVRSDTPADRALRAIDAATATAAGESFFRALVSQLVVVFGAQCAFIARLDSDGMLRSVAGWSRLGAQPRIEYPLAASPCGEADRGAVRLIANGLRDQFPQFCRAIGVDAQGVLITPLHDSRGERIGSIALLQDAHPPDSQLCPEVVLRIFAGRVAAELERLRQVEELCAGEQRFRVLAEMSNDVISRLSPEGVFTYVSPASREALGYEPWQMIGKSALHFVHPDDLASMEAVFQSLFHERDRVAMEVRRRCHDGSYRWFETSFRAHREEETHVVDWVTCTARDIHDRKQIEAELVRKESDLRRAQAVSHVGSWHLDIVANVLSWSDETYRIFGLPVGLALNMEQFFARVHPEDRDQVGRKWSAALGGEEYDVEHRIIVGGTERWVRERAEIRFGKDGNPFDALGTVQDITRHVSMEQELGRRQIMLARAEDLAGIGGFEIEVRGNIIHGSSGLACKLGVGAEAIPCPLSSLVHRTVHPDDREALLAAVAHSCSEGASLDIGVRILRPDGRVVPMDLRADPIRDSTGRVSRLSGFVRSARPIAGTIESERIA